MALGNANASAQSRGKNKPVIVKRRKEVVVAKGYTEILGTAVNGTSACALSLGSNKYYHDGSGTFPATNDKVYSRQRANSKYGLKNGYYKGY